jgi:hypothetical protein
VLAFFFLRNYEEVVLNSFNTRLRIGLAITVLSIYLFLASYWGQWLVFWLYESFLLLGNQIQYSYSAGGKGGFSLKLMATFIFMRVPYFYYRLACPKLTRLPEDI